MSDDDSTSDSSDVALLFNKSDAGIKAGMAVDSSDEEEDDTGIQLYMGTKTNADNDIEDSMNETAMRRAARERKRRSAHLNLDEEDEEVSFVPKSQTKKSTSTDAKIISLLGDSEDQPTAKNLYQDSSDDEEERPLKCAKATITAAVTAASVFNPETTRRLMELRASSRRVNANTSQVFDVDDDGNVPTSTTRWIKVSIEGTNKSASFTMSESNCAKDLITMCIEKFQLDPTTPIALSFDNRILSNTDLFFDIPVQCEMIAKVHKLTVKEAPKGKLMRLTLRGPSGDKEIQIGELQTLQVALDLYGAGTKLKFDGDVMDLNRRPGCYELEDEDLIDVV